MKFMIISFISNIVIFETSMPRSTINHFYEKFVRSKELY